MIRLSGILNFNPLLLYSSWKDKKLAERRKVTHELISEYSRIDQMFKKAGETFELAKEKMLRSSSHFEQFLREDEKLPEKNGAVTIGHFRYRDKSGKNYSTIRYFDCHGNAHITKTFDRNTGLITFLSERGTCSNGDTITIEKYFSEGKLSLIKLIVQPKDTGDLKTPRKYIFFKDPEHLWELELKTGDKIVFDVRKEKDEKIKYKMAEELLPVLQAIRSR